MDRDTWSRRFLEGLAVLCVGRKTDSEGGVSSLVEVELAVYAEGSFTWRTTQTNVIEMPFGELTIMAPAKPLQIRLQNREVIRVDSEFQDIANVPVSIREMDDEIVLVFGSRNGNFIPEDEIREMIEAARQQVSQTA